jgi:hypothetical protein
MNYVYRKPSGVLAGTYEFRGPGLDSEVPPRLRLSGDFEAERICVSLQRAYEAGRRDFATEIRQLIGAK